MKPAVQIVVYVFLSNIGSRDSRCDREVWIAIGGSGFARGSGVQCDPPFRGDGRGSDWTLGSAPESDEAGAASEYQGANSSRVCHDPGPLEMAREYRGVVRSANTDGIRSSSQRHGRERRR